VNAEEIYLLLYSTALRTLSLSTPLITTLGLSTHFNAILCLCKGFRDNIFMVAKIDLLTVLSNSVNKWKLY